MCMFDVYAFVSTQSSQGATDYSVDMKALSEIDLCTITYTLFITVS